MNEMDQREDEATVGGTSDRSAKVRTIGSIVVAALVAAVALAAIFTSTSGGDSDRAADPSEAADELASLTFVNEDGSEGSLADFRGEPLVVNFFASWCAPCRAELPDLEAVHVASGDRLQFVGVNHDVDDTSWLSFVDETEITFPTVFQPNQELFAYLGLLGMPSTVLVDADGEVVHRFSGILDDVTLKELIAEHLDVEV